MNLSKTEKVMKKVGKSLSDLLSDKERKKEKMPVETYWNFLKIKENSRLKLARQPKKNKTEEHPDKAVFDIPEAAKS